MAKNNPNIPDLGAWAGLYLLPELQPVYDFENSEFSLWFAPEFGKVYEEGRIFYIKPGWDITSLILEVPIACLTEGEEPVIGGWTTASLRQARVLNPAPRFSNPEDLGPSVEGGAWTQVSRLANPLVNELVIGLPAKDRFNASEPMDDAQFLEFVTHPTLPEIIEILFGAAAGVQAPNFFPRDDLVATFLTGIPATVLPLGLQAAGNQPANVIRAEMMRLNTTTPVTPAFMQNSFGVIGFDVAGSPMAVGLAMTW